ncbi:hypothetical protein METBIDRAFT_32014 [Metschnikowia bicuspidata var. bicuspidata NRRL YB-4993]|uniref:Regulator of rDNA transcription protein 5 n=1 Tax=Metschnikowia bicuspidata var. bicuspidata NRRL YB-4993 TaxID=869754 RepID=A0A1A0HBI1_9ASCO|nr:hypothetical protein METBIDRAFT_32014 [Metschnikowia bicuspidata var. bicuspidata NRRL YB-4993]OBA21494.1 hypothetical protein METBIDRAFT_32014 [Metschnikowia bicuspidata var. bicuspidata NRRL YB-4993]
MTTQSKVYISNLNYQTTEDELREYLASTKATNVFIPNYFVGFGSLKFKPLGIAYADLPTTEDAEEFIKEFEGKLFKDRKLKIKLHVPYSPSQKPTRLSSVKRLSKKEGDDPREDNEESSSAELIQSPVERKFSDNAVFVKGLKAKTCDDDLKAIFKDFNPTGIKIFKPRGWMRGLKHRSHNAIITLDLPELKTLEEVIESCTGEKCCGNSIIVTRAYLNEDRGIDAKEEEEDQPEHTDDLPHEKAEDRAVEKPAQEGEAKKAAETVSASKVSPKEKENSKHESVEPTIQSSEQENASKEAILDVKGESEEV